MSTIFIFYWSRSGLNVSPKHKVCCLAVYVSFVSLVLIFGSQIHFLVKNNFRIVIDTFLCLLLSLFIIQEVNFVFLQSRKYIFLLFMCLVIYLPDFFLLLIFVKSSNLCKNNSLIYSNIFCICFFSKSKREFISKSKRIKYLFFIFSFLLI